MVSLLYSRILSLNFDGVYASMSKNDVSIQSFINS